MKRYQLFEFTDQDWLPKTFRNYLTELLAYQASAIYSPVAPKLKAAMQKCHYKEIVDLCSGAGGPWVHLQRLLATQEEFPVSVILSDKYPQPYSLGNIAPQMSENIRYLDEQVDATAVPRHLKGFRTIFTSFHHFRPVTATKILQDAAERQVPIGIFEFTERKWSSVFAMLFSPVMVWIQTPAIKPFRWGRLFWTYIVPLVPCLYMWDGLVSHMRTYTVEELEALALKLGAEQYCWQAERIKSETSDPITFLIGYPSVS